MSLTDQEFIRFSRHIMLDEVGESGQIKIKNAHVLIIGMGGLGCAAGQYLTAAGIGQLTLIDHDHIEMSNLQRQILFNHNDINKAKVSVAKAKLEQINPKLKVTTYSQSVFDVELENRLTNVDVVLDCTDNSKTRHFINQLCVKTKTKLVSAAAIQGKGQLISFDFSQQSSPCYQCLVPDEVQEVKSCSSLGVLSPLLGVMGSLQATEVFRLLVNKATNKTTNKVISNTLETECKLTQLLIFDAWKMTFKRLTITADPNCPCCKNENRESKNT